jgi:hypothetical protein
MLKNIKKPEQKQEVENSKPDISFQEKIERLRDVATKKTENNEIVYLLYRPTIEFEYENGVKDLEFVTDSDSEWIADFDESQAKRHGDAPIISAWIPEKDVKDVLNAFGQENNTWGELGTNPNKNKYRVLVKPGTYKLHQELKKSNSVYKYLGNLKKFLSESNLKVTNQRHLESPGKDASGLIPNSDKPKDIKHIRADTMTHMNLELEKTSNDSLSKPSHNTYIRGMAPWLESKIRGIF